MQLDTSRLKNPSVEESKPAMETPASSPPAPPSEPLTAEQIQEIRKQIEAVLKTCYDPEIPVDIVELGLIYGVAVSPLGVVAVRMTLTTPACPVAGSLPGEVQRKISALPGVSTTQVNLVWDPPWTKSKMSEAAKLRLGIDD